MPSGASTTSHPSGALKANPLVAAMPPVNMRTSCMGQIAERETDRQSQRFAETPASSGVS